MFKQNDVEQKAQRERILVPIYQRLKERQLIRVYGCTNKNEQKYGDTILIASERAQCVIEEKIVKWPKTNRPYEAFTLEEWSCTVPGYRKVGWMAAKYDWLLYVCMRKDARSADCYLMNFPALQGWFWRNCERWRIHITDQINRTQCRLVPISEIEAVITVKHFVAPTQDMVLTDLMQRVSDGDAESRVLRELRDGKWRSITHQKDIV